jgi:tRNA pseudouridine38-40 synthase
MRLALTVEYEGTNYRGFQYQTNAPSVQEELEKAIQRFTGESVRVKGAGRTDAGVHARAQVVAFDTATTHPKEAFLGALNRHLPDDIAVRKVHSVPDDFDPRRMAKSRRYAFTIDTGPVRSPLTRRTTHHIARPLDVGKMRRAARHFVGRHDFARFAGPLEKADASTVREVTEAAVRRSGHGHTVTLEVEGGSFLPHQVRRMAGALVDVGQGRLTPAELKSMVDGDEVDAVAHSLPPQGLCLVKIEYEDFVTEGDS